MKVGADIGEGAEHEQAFDKSHGDHGARPWRAEHGCIVGDKSARARGAGMAGMRNGIAQEFDEQGNGRDCKQRGEKKEHLSPAKEIAENAAGCDGEVPPFLNVHDMAALLGGTKRVVGLDTGFSHLAAALGKPTIGIYCDHEPGLAGIVGPGGVASVGGKGQVPSLQQVLALVEQQRALP